MARIVFDKYRRSVKSSVLNDDDLDEIEYRCGLWYEAGTDILFSGKSKCIYTDFHGMPVVTVCNYFNGQEHGTWEMYNDQQILVMRIGYSFGVREGAFEGYDPNDGSLFFTGGYKNGEKDGLWTVFSNSGDVISSMYWIKGQKVN